MDIAARSPEVVDHFSAMIAHFSKPQKFFFADLEF
jgi:hypothetical protein